MAVPREKIRAGDGALLGAVSAHTPENQPGDTVVSYLLSSYFS